MYSGTQIACPWELRRPAREFDSCHQSPRSRLRSGLPGIPGPVPWLPLSASTLQFRVVCSLLGEGCVHETAHVRCPSSQQP